MSDGFWAMTRSTVPSFNISMAVCGGIKGHDLDLAAEALVLHDRACALRAEDVGAEDAGQIGFLLQHGFDLRLGLGGIVVVVVHADQLHVGVRGDDFLAALLAGIGAADAGVHVLDVDLALAADRFDQRFAGDLAALLRYRRR